jgi:Ca2+-binding RTX toxin-like protein
VLDMHGRLILVAAVVAAVVTGAAFARSLDVITGTPGPDTLEGTPAADVIYARAGDDVAFGRDGPDVLYGQAGSDELHGGDGRDVAYGGHGDDVIRGGGDGDIEYGGYGDDSLWGGQGADQLFGGPGDDVLHALANDNQGDVVDCGPGRDKAWLNVKERGLYRVRACETVFWVVPTAEQEAEEDAG